MKACVSDSFAGARVAMPIGAPRPIGAMNRAPKFRPTSTHRLTANPEDAAADLAGTDCLPGNESAGGKGDVSDRISLVITTDSSALGMLLAAIPADEAPRYRVCGRRRAGKGGWSA